MNKTAGLSAFVLLLAVLPVLETEAGPSAESIPAAGNAWHIALADVTGNGRQEVVYACYDGKVCCQQESSGKVVWSCDTHAFPYDMTAGDLDGDGKAETLVASSDGRLYVTTQTGTTVAFAADPEKFEVLSVNPLDETTNSTIAISDGQIFLRTYEALYCIQQK